MAYTNATDPKTYVAGNPLTAAELNTYQRDNVDAIIPLGDDWDTYSPSTANLTEGNGTTDARYIQLAQVVLVKYTFVFGSTSSISSTPDVDLPVNASGDYQDFETIGYGLLRDATGNLYGAAAVLDSSNRDSFQIRHWTTTLSGINSTTPFTWTTSDIITVSLRYIPT